MLKVLIQLISIYRAVAMFVFVLFYTLIPLEANIFLLVTSILSDLVDGYLAKKYNLTTTGGGLLDLFSDKYLNCISIIFLVIEKYPLMPLVFILTKEIFILSFRSIEINGSLVIRTNRILGGTMSCMLWIAVFFHISNIQIIDMRYYIIILGFLNLLYLIYKIVSNISNLKEVFKD